MQKQVLISGANGFFGTIACNYFRAHGWNVIKAGRKPLVSDIIFDLDEPYQFAKRKINQDVNLFIHAAASHEVDCQINPYESVARNVIGTKAALDFCVNNNIKNFVYISTFHVFGNTIGIINENIVPKPLNDYGLSHFMAEQYVTLYNKTKNINGLVIRPTNFIDIPANMSTFNRWTLTPYAFCKAAIEENEIVLNTPGYQKRNFVSVQDICQVIETCFDKNLNQEILHIYGPNSLSIRELAFLVQKVVYRDYGIHVELKIPNGEDLNQKYQYESMFLNDIFIPKATVETFVKSMVSKLINEHQRGK